jgi:hypothetical protein
MDKFVDHDTSRSRLPVSPISGSVEWEPNIPTETQLPEVVASIFTTDTTGTTKPYEEFESMDLDECSTGDDCGSSDFEAWLQSRNVNLTSSFKVLRDDTIPHQGIFIFDCFTKVHNTQVVVWL